MLASSTREAIGPSLARFGSLTALLGARLYLKTTIGVPRHWPFRGQDPLRIRHETLDTRRIHFEHEELIPANKRRIVVRAIFIGGLVCLFLSSELLTAR